MRNIIVLVAVLAVTSGLTGAFAVRHLSGEAGAAPQPPQAREDQITVFSDSNLSFTASIVPSPFGYGPLSGAGPILVVVDAADYPPSSVFRFEGVWRAASGSTSCLRLFDLTATAPVVASEACHTVPQNTGSEPVRVRSSTFSLPSGEHEYTVEGRCDPVSVTTCSGSGVAASRIIAEWTERR